MAKSPNPVTELVRENWDTGDRWGSAIGALFDIALTLWRLDVWIPSSWGFSPGAAPQEPPTDGDGYLEQELYAGVTSGLWTYDDLRAAGKVIERLGAIYHGRGMSY